MLFNSFDFIAFFAMSVIVYFIVPKKTRYLWLLFCSLFFYSLWSISNTILLILSAIVTWGIGLICRRTTEDNQNTKWKKAACVSGIVLLIIELFIFKYLAFTIKEVIGGLSSIFMEGEVSLPTISLIMPIGISFYVFQSIGYLVDVFKGKSRAESNLPKFLLFITFFPKIIQGPIERTGEDSFLDQINHLSTRSSFDYKRVTNGLIKVLYGFFLKMVIADRIAIIADQVFNTYYVYGTMELMIGAVCYAIQIYCDFAGYSAIAVGSASVFGIKLIENFDTPYLSSSTKEFWRRWHISLSTWFRDYIYIPLGGSRCSKWRKKINVMITMLVSGIWHGAGWNYIVWGLLHGLYQCADLKIINRAGEKLKVRKNTFSYWFGKVIITFIFVDLAWIFFRSESVGSAIEYIIRMFTHWNPWVIFDGSLLLLGLAQNEYNILFFSVLIMIIVDLVQYSRHIHFDEMLENQNLWFKWGIIILLFTFIWVFGMYGPDFNGNDFIYLKF